MGPALANAGLAWSPDVLVGHGRLMLGTAVALVLGKLLGILLGARAAVTLGIATKPAAYTWRQVAGAGALGGIGFTMSLFVTELAFADPALIEASKTGILGASIVAGLVGYAILRLGSPGGGRDPMADPAH